MPNNIIVYYRNISKSIDHTVIQLSQNACREISHDLAFVDCYRGKTADGKVCTLPTRLCS